MASNAIEQSEPVAADLSNQRQLSLHKSSVSCKQQAFISAVTAPAVVARLKRCNDFHCLGSTNLSSPQIWATNLPGETNPSPDPNGFMSVAELACSMPNGVLQATSISCKRPSDLPEGDVLVVGASAIGVQLARETRATDRLVTLAAERHTRLPRTYRSYDIEWWLHTKGVLDKPYDAVDDIESARKMPSPQLIGGPEPVDLNALQACGVRFIIRARRSNRAYGSKIRLLRVLSSLCVRADHPEHLC